MRCVRPFVAVGVGLFASGTGCAHDARRPTPDTACGPGWFDPPKLEAAIAPPAGERLIAHLAASGTQAYWCSTGDTDGGASAGWAFQGPEATLVDCHGTPAGRHFASVGGPSAPEWLALDGSFVIAKKVASVASPRAETIPWLLLQVTSSGGDGLLAPTRHIVRATTEGGVPPAAACDAAVAGAEIRVPYSADYWFYAR
jgi:hypothetical protein